MDYIGAAKAHKKKSDDNFVDYIGAARGNIQTSTTNTPSIDERIAQAKNRLEDAKKKKKAAFNGWGAAAMQAKGGSTAARLREKAGLPADDFDWQGAINAKDYVATAKADLTAAKNEKWFDDAASDLANLQNTASGNSRFTNNLENAQKTLQSDFGDWLFFTDDELATLMTLQESDPEAAKRYYEIIEYNINERKAKSAAEGLDKQGKIGNLGTFLASGFATPFAYLNTLGAGIREGITGEYKPVDLNSDAYAAVRAKNQARENLTGDIDNGFVKFLADTGLSIADYLTKLPFGSAGALSIMSSGSAADTAYDAMSRGASASDAAWSGLVAGATEFLTEKLPLDNLLKLAKGNIQLVSKEGITNVLKQAGIEGSEELISDYLTTLSDIAINGENSTYNKTVESYLAQGMNTKEAEQQAVKDIFISNPLQSFAGGALSGGVMGTGGLSLGKKFVNNNDIDSLADEAYNYINSETPERNIDNGQQNATNTDAETTEGEYSSGIYPYSGNTMHPGNESGRQDGRGNQGISGRFRNLVSPETKRFTRYWSTKQRG